VMGNQVGSHSDQRPSAQVLKDQRPSAQVLKWVKLRSSMS